MRRRAEARCGTKRSAGARRLASSTEPITAKGKFALARAARARRHAGAAQLVAPGLARGHLLGASRAQRDGDVRRGR
jgi:hypothetical protein